MSAPWVYAYRGVSWGLGTKLIVQDVAGFGVPPFRTTATPRSASHGDFPGKDTLGSRELVFKLEVGSDDSNVEDILGTLDAAWMPTDQLFPFEFHHSPRPPLVAFCRPGHLDYPLDRRYYVQSVTVDLTLRAPDPFFYTDPVSTVTIPAYAAAGGFRFPIDFNYSFGGGGATGLVVVRNTGTVKTYPVLTAHGYSEGVVVQNLTTGQSFELSLNLGTNDFVVCDFTPGAHTVLLGGVSSYRGTVTPQSTFFALNPGDNLLSYHARGVTDGNARVDVSWRSAYPR